MRFTVGGSSTRPWQPPPAGDTTDLRYWMRWQVALCALWVLCCMAVAAYLVWRHEGPGAHRRPGGAGKERRHSRPAGVLYDDEAWRPCLRDVHPAWMLGYRLVSFFVLLSLLVVIVISDGGDIFFYYTQWTFILVTIYFGVGPAFKQFISSLNSFSTTIYAGEFYVGEIVIRTRHNCCVNSVQLGTALSIYGCSKFTEWDAGAAMTDAEHLPYAVHGGAAKPGPGGEDGAREIAGFWGYLLQIIYQTNAGAVMLTDCVFWFIIFPFLTMKDYSLNFLLIGMHSVNAVFLLGEAALNSLRFPWFRIAYFFLWTALYVVFQWIVHASTPTWWPYPFLDLSANLAPLWYLAVAVMQLPCYALFRLVIKLKHHLLIRRFPDSTVMAD